MSKNILLLFCLLLFSINIQSQNKVIDSLKKKLLVYKANDTTRVNILNDLAYAYYQIDSNKTLTYLKESETLANTINYTKGKGRSIYLKGIAQSNFDESFQFINEALQLYKSINFKQGVIDCYHEMGMLYYDNDDQRQAIEYYQKSVLISEEIGNKKKISVSLNNIGKAYTNIGNYTEALKYHKKALNISKELGDEKRMSTCFNNIGTIFSDQGNYPVALQYYNQSLAIDEKFGDTLELSKSLNNLGIIYRNIQNYDKAIACYEKALEFQKKNINKKNTAEILNNLGLVYKNKKSFKEAHKYLKDALKISEEINNKMYIATCLNNIADVYLLLNDYTVAFQYFENAERINLQVDNQRGLCYSYLGMARVYVNQKKYNKALLTVIKSEEISAKLELMDPRRDAQQLLSEIYESLGNYKKSLENHQQFKILNDSIFNKENIEKITQLEYEYKYKQAMDSANIRELKLTKTVRDTSQNLEKTQRNLFLGVIIFLFLALMLGGFIFFLKLRNEKSKTQNIEIEQKLLRSQMTPHFIFNSLSVLQGMILNKEDEKAVYYLSKFSKLLRITLENSRDKMVPLAEELEAINNYLELQNLEVNTLYQYTITVEESIDQTSVEIPPMLIQPFIENAIEHAFKNQTENRKIDIKINCLNKQLICTITDNGIGINAQNTIKNHHKKSLATTITSERLQMLSKDYNMDGSVTIEDRQKYNEHGTVVTMIFPYKISAV